jgi:hypothetical protein
MVTSIRFTHDGVTDRLYRPKSFVQEALRGHFGTRRRIMRYGDGVHGRQEAGDSDPLSSTLRIPVRPFLRLRERDRGRFIFINPRSACV